MFKESQIKQPRRNHRSLLDQALTQLNANTNPFRLRQKSEGFMDLSLFDSSNKLQCFLKDQKTISDFELIDIKDIIESLMLKSTSGESDSVN